MFDFNHTNFPAMKADLLSINWIEYLNAYTDMYAMWCVFSRLLNNIIYIVSFLVVVVLLILNVYS